MPAFRRTLPFLTTALAVAGGTLIASHLSHGISSVVEASPASAPVSAMITPKVERLDPALDAIVPAQPSLEQLASGFKWVEGPTWIIPGVLYFAEIPSNSIHKWTESTGDSIFMQPSGYKGSIPYGGPEPGSNGMTIDYSGRLTAAGHAQRDIWRLEKLDGRVDAKAPITILADQYQGKQLNSPNDLVYKSDGSLYFTDPPYGLRTQKDSDPAKQLPFNGVYRIPAAAAQKPGSAPNRDALQLLIKDLSRPNGIAFSPDEKYLYVSNTEPNKVWMRYPVKPDGTVGEGKVFCDANGDHRRGSPDGIKVDREGNVYGAGPGGVWIISPDGKHLGTIDFTENVSNVAWGGADRRTLYITATSGVYRITLKIPGIYPHIR